jgi:hypothetical protein
MLLPDGNVYPPGTLTLCDTRAFSPVSNFHETFVDGFPVGILISRRRVSEGVGDSPAEVMFHRDSEGRLRLFGYVLPTGGKRITFLLAEPTRASRSRGRSVASDLPRQVREPLVLVAASTPTGEPARPVLRRKAGGEDRPARTGPDDRP